MITELELRRRIRDVLARMSVLASADSESIVQFNPNGAYATKIPDGVRTTTPLDRMSSTDSRTLLDEWATRFADLTGRSRHEQVCYLLAAEAALDQALHRPPDRLTDEHDDPSLETVKRCLTIYEGMPPEQAAVIEATVYGGSVGSLTKWLERQRISNDRNPKDGRPRPTGEGRRRRVAELRAQGMGAPRIAKELGIATTTAQRVIRELEHDTRRAA